MAKSKKPRKRGLSKTELAKQQGSDLPDREAMSLVNANLAAPINAAVADGPVGASASRGGS